MSGAATLIPVTGKQAFRACRLDRRFAYCGYVPHAYTQHTAANFRILVTIHGSGRDAEPTRDLFIDLAEETGCIIVSPLFPTAMTDEDEYHNYFWLNFGGIRYDRIMLAMITEVAGRYGVPGDRVAMAGFSGGGQFVHRFLYLYPEKLSAASIGAPGMITLLDPAQDWFVGTKGVRGALDRDVDLAAIRRVPAHVVVGSADIDPAIMVEPDSPLFMPGINDSGRTRVERAQTLHAELLRNGVHSEFDLVPGAAHSAQHVYLAVAAFLRRALNSPAS